MGMTHYYDEWKLIYSNYDYNVFVQYASYSSIFSPNVESVIVGIKILQNENIIYDNPHGYRNICSFPDNFMRSIDNVLFYLSTNSAANIEQLIENVIFHNESTLFNCRMEQQKRKCMA